MNTDDSKNKDNELVKFVGEALQEVIDGMENIKNINRCHILSAISCVFSNYLFLHMDDKSDEGVKKTISVINGLMQESFKLRLESYNEFLKEKESLSELVEKLKNACG